MFALLVDLGLLVWFPLHDGREQDVGGCFRDSWRLCLFVGGRALGVCPRARFAAGRLILLAAAQEQCDQRSRCECKPQFRHRYRPHEKILFITLAHHSAFTKRIRRCRSRALDAAPFHDGPEVRVRRGTRMAEVAQLACSFSWQRGAGLGAIGRRQPCTQQNGGEGNHGWATSAPVRGKPLPILALVLV